MKCSVLFGVLVGLGALGCAASSREIAAEPTNAAVSVAPSTTTLAAGSLRPREMAVDATHVYWTASASSDGRFDVLRVAKRGGTVETLATGESQVTGLTTDGTHVYWLASTGARRMSKAGGEVTAIASHLPQAPSSSTTLVDDARLYWSGDDGIWSVSKSGGTPVLFAAARPSAMTALLAQDETTIYWADSSGLWSQSKEGRERAKLLDESPSHAAVDASSLYYASHGTIMRLPKTGGAPIALGRSGGGDEHGIVVSGDFVFWTDVVDQQIRRLPTRGDIAAETLIAGEVATSLFVDASGTYYVANNGLRRWVL